MTSIRFVIGNAFPAADPVARFVTGLGMISNDWLRSMRELLALEGDGLEEAGLRMSIFRRQAALVHEAAAFIADARRRFPEIAAFMDALEEPARRSADHADQVLGAVDLASPRFLGDWLEGHRNVTNHYPELHPAAAAHGKEKMATALEAAASIESSIDSGDVFGDARFRFADDVAAQLLPSLDDLEWLKGLRETAAALADFAQRAAQAYLETRPSGTFTVE